MIVARCVAAVHLEDNKRHIYQHILVLIDFSAHRDLVPRGENPTPRFEIVDTCHAGMPGCQVTNDGRTPSCFSSQFAMANWERWRGPS